MKKMVIAAIVASASSATWAGCGAGVGWSSALDGAMCALKLTTKQISSSAEKAMDQKAAVTEIKANTDKELRLTIRTIDIANKFAALDKNGNALGQSPYQCAVRTIEDSMGKSKKEADAGLLAWSNGVYTSEAVQGQETVLSVFGQNVVTRASRKASELTLNVDMHNQRFCTQQEALAGVCELQPNGMQGADSDVERLVGAETFSFDQQIAATAYASRVAPVKSIPKEAIASSGCTSANCRATMAMHRRTESLRATARYSLMKAIESRTTAERNGEMGTFKNN